MLSGEGVEGHPPTEGDLHHRIHFHYLAVDLWLQIQGHTTLDSALACFRSSLFHQCPESDLSLNAQFQPSPHAALYMPIYLTSHGMFQGSDFNLLDLILVEQLSAIHTSLKQVTEVSIRIELAICFYSFIYRIRCHFSRYENKKIKLGLVTRFDNKSE